MALINPEQEEAAAQRAWVVRQECGHPKERWEALIERIQGEAIRDFSRPDGNRLLLESEYLRVIARKP